MPRVNRAGRGSGADSGKNLQKLGVAACILYHSGVPNTPSGRRIGTMLSSLLAFFAVAGIAGVLVAVLLTPAVALSGAGAKQGIGLFEALPGDLKIGALQQRTSIYATSHGKPVLLASFYAQNRVVIPWDSVPLSVQDATIAGEDVRFYHHGGVDANAIVRAAVADVLGKSLQGASTITQQYVKNVCVQQSEAITDAAKAQAAYEECIDPSAGRKVREMRLAIGLEKKYTKNEILLGYLNIAGFGGRVYGIEAAAEYYFGVQAKQLTVPQAAALIAIVNNPEHFRLDEKANLPAATDRRDHILAVERDQGMISAAAYRDAVASPITTHLTAPPTGCDAAGVAGFFCDYVKNVLETDPTFGETQSIREANLQTKGWKVTTTLNLDLQRTAQKVMNTYVPKSTRLFDVGGAAVSVQPGTGRVVSMVQNKDYDASGSRGGSELALHGGELQRRHGARRRRRPAAGVDVQALPPDRLAEDRAHALPDGQRQPADHPRVHLREVRLAGLRRQGLARRQRRAEREGQLHRHGRHRRLRERRLRLPRRGERPLPHPRPRAVDGRDERPRRQALHRAGDGDRGCELGRSDRHGHRVRDHREPRGDLRPDRHRRHHRPGRPRDRRCRRRTAAAPSRPASRPRSRTRCTA